MICKFKLNDIIKFTSTSNYRGMPDWYRQHKLKITEIHDGWLSARKVLPDGTLATGVYTRACLEHDELHLFKLVEGAVKTCQ